MMSSLGQIFRPFARYADFSGRASRTEYWGFTLLVLILALLAVTIELRFGLPRLGMIFGPLTLALGLVTFIPGLAVQTRRLHDIGVSGWWALLLWAPYLATMLFFYGQSGVDLTMMLDSGWVKMMLLWSALQAAGGFAMFALLIQRGRRGPNRYGNDPFDVGEAVAV